MWRMENGSSLLGIAGARVCGMHISGLPPFARRGKEEEVDCASVRKWASSFSSSRRCSSPRWIKNLERRPPPRSTSVEEEEKEEGF